MSVKNVGVRKASNKPTIKPSGKPSLGAFKRVDPAKAQMKKGK